MEVFCKTIGTLYNKIGELYIWLINKELHIQFDIATFISTCIVIYFAYNKINELNRIKMDAKYGFHKQLKLLCENLKSSISEEIERMIPNWGLWYCLCNDESLYQKRNQIFAQKFSNELVNEFNHFLSNHDNQIAPDHCRNKKEIIDWDNEINTLRKYLQYFTYVNYNRPIYDCTNETIIEQKYIELMGALDQIIKIINGDPSRNSVRSSIMRKCTICKKVIKNQCNILLNSIRTRFNLIMRWRKKPQ